MTDLRQAAQQALEALQYASTGNRRPEIIGPAITALRTALRTALAQQAEPVAWMFQHDETGRMNYVSNDGMNTPELFLKGNPRYALVCPLYAAPPAAQPQQKPMHPELRKMWEDYFDKCFRESSEPVPENFMDALKFDVVMREWVGLTDEEQP